MSQIPSQPKTADASTAPGWPVRSSGPDRDRWQVGRSIRTLMGLAARRDVQVSTGKLP